MEDSADEEQLLQVVYASAATEAFSEGDLQTLLSKARANNETLGVSGILLFKEGSFLQVLEGPPDAILQLYTKIGLDQRHGRVIKLLERPIEERQFGDWSMGYVPENVTAAAAIPGFNDFFRWRETASAQPDAAGALRVVQAFGDGRYRASVEG